MKASKSITLAAMLAAAAVAATARTAADFFADAPVAVIDIFDRSTRMDMLDYFRNGMPTASANVFGGRSRITALSDSSLTVAVSDRSSLQLAPLVLKADTLVAVIETVATPVPDSNVSFYRAADWSRVDVDTPPAADFLPDAATKGRRRRDAMPEGVPYIFYTVEYVPATGLFVFTNTTARNYSADDMPEAVAGMPAQRSYSFDGRRFRLWTPSD